MNGFELLETDQSLLMWEVPTPIENSQLQSAHPDVQYSVVFFGQIKVVSTVESTVGPPLYFSATISVSQATCHTLPVFIPLNHCGEHI